MGRLLMQLNIPEHFANPTMDERPKMMEQEHEEKLVKVILPQSDHPAVVQAPRFGLTHLLAAADMVVLQEEVPEQGHLPKMLVASSQ